MLDIDFILNGQDVSNDFDVLKVVEDLGNKITAELIEELIEIHDMYLPEERKVSMQFFSEYDENRRYGRILTNKVNESFGGTYRAIAWAYNNKNKPEYKQLRDGLLLRRISVPIYVRDILYRHKIINCVNYEEIMGYSFMEEE